MATDNALPADSSVCCRLMSAVTWTGWVTTCMPNRPAAISSAVTDAAMSSNQGRRHRRGLATRASASGAPVSGPGATWACLADVDLIKRAKETHRSAHAANSGRVPHFSACSFSRRSSVAGNTIPRGSAVNQRKCR